MFVFICICNLTFHVSQIRSVVHVSLYVSLCALFVIYMHITSEYFSHKNLFTFSEGDKGFIDISALICHIIPQPLFAYFDKSSF